LHCRSLRKSMTAFWDPAGPPRTPALLPRSVLRLFSRLCSRRFAAGRALPFSALMFDCFSTKNFNIFGWWFPGEVGKVLSQACCILPRPRRLEVRLDLRLVTCWARCGFFSTSLCFSIPSTPLSASEVYCLTQAICCIESLSQTSMCPVLVALFLACGPYESFYPYARQAGVRAVGLRERGKGLCSPPWLLFISLIISGDRRHARPEFFLSRRPASLPVHEGSPGSHRGHYILSSACRRVLPRRRHPSFIGRSRGRRFLFLPFVSRLDDLQAVCGGLIESLGE